MLVAQNNAIIKQLKNRMETAQYFNGIKLTRLVGVVNKINIMNNLPLEKHRIFTLINMIFMTFILIKLQII